MTKNEYKQACEAVILARGFKSCGQGCPCNGSPYIYRRDRCEIDVWAARGLWKLFVRGSTHATGTSISDLHNQLNNLQQ